MQIGSLAVAAVAALWASDSFAADSYTEALAGILNSNRTLRAAALQKEAAESENMTGLTLSNPEVDFAYQWGTPTDDKVLLDVSQGFDFATLSGAKKRVAARLNGIASAEFDAERLRIMSEADALMTQAVYCSRLDSLYAEIESVSGRLLEAARISMEKGELSALEVNGMRMDLAGVKVDRRMNLVEMKGIMARLASMAGVKDFSWIPKDYMVYSLPPDFSSWGALSVEKMPEVARSLAETAAADAEISLRKREGLPDFSLGYTSEMVRDDNHYGVKVGVSLPLWGNRGRVKAAKAARAAALAREEDARLTAMMDLQLKYDKAQALGMSASECGKIAMECDNSASIRKLYELGQISETDCLERIGRLFSLRRQSLDAEYAYQQALAELRAASASY